MSFTLDLLIGHHAQGLVRALLEARAYGELTKAQKNLLVAARAVLTTNRSAGDRGREGGRDG